MREGLLAIALFNTLMIALAQTPEPGPIAGVQHRFIQTNGIRMHIAEAGSGPLVVLIHGFPELWYSYRHVIPALAAAGYKVVAPDMRGYGQTDAPPNIEDYSQFQLVGDVVGLIRGLGYEQAVVVGHDWGAPVAFNTALLRPDLIRGVALLSVPFSVRAEGGVKPTEGMKARMPQGMVFYQTYFQTPGVAEQDFEGDVKKAMRSLLYSASGSIPKEHKWRYIMKSTEKASDTVTDPPQLPKWLTEADVDYYAKQFSRTGFRGGLNWYRNQDLWWLLTPFLVGRKLTQPTLYIAGSDDPVVEFAKAGIDNLEKSVPNLWRKVMLPGVGHWTEQEAPAEVNKYLVEFLAHLAKGK
jgi:pimeloyl-ACP methyl ester carboxylesterase